MIDAAAVVSIAKSTAVGWLGKVLADRGIGALARPWQMRREGRAAADVKRVLAQAEADADALRTGKARLGPGGEVIALPAVTSAGAGGDSAWADEHEPARLLPMLEGEPVRLMLEAVDASAAADRIRREVNVARAVIVAEAETRQSEAASADAGAPAAPPDPDWLYRWRDAASEVSAEEVQRLWGRVLAGEVRSPGSYSLRTLEFLRHVSQQEAATIERLGQFVITAKVAHAGDLIAAQAESPPAEGGVPTGLLIEAETLGLVTGVVVNLNYTPGSWDNGSFVCLIRGFNPTAESLALLVTGPDSAKRPQLKGLAVTRLGQEVFRLISPQPPEWYLRAIGAGVAAQGFSVRLTRGVPLEDGRLNFGVTDGEAIEAPAADPAA